MQGVIHFVQELRGARRIRALIAESNDQKLLQADAILGFRRDPARMRQGCFSVHGDPAMRSRPAATCAFRANGAQRSRSVRTLWNKVAVTIRWAHPICKDYAQTRTGDEPPYAAARRSRSYMHAAVRLTEFCVGREQARGA